MRISLWNVLWASCMRFCCPAEKCTLARPVDALTLVFENNFARSRVAIWAFVDQPVGAENETLWTQQAPKLLAAFPMRNKLHVMKPCVLNWLLNQGKSDFLFSRLGKDALMAHSISFWLGSTDYASCPTIVSKEKELSWSLLEAYSISPLGNDPLLDHRPVSAILEDIGTLQVVCTYFCGAVKPGLRKTGHTCACFFLSCCNSIAEHKSDVIPTRPHRSRILAQVIRIRGCCYDSMISLMHWSSYDAHNHVHKW